MDMVGQQFDEIWTCVKSITDVNSKIEKEDYLKKYIKKMSVQF